MSRVQWTDDMDAALGTVTDVELAARWHVNYKTVEHRRNALGITAFRTTPSTKSSNELVGAVLYEMRRQGKSVREIASERGTSLVVVYKEIKRYLRAVDQGR